MLEQVTNNKNLKSLSDNIPDELKSLVYLHDGLVLVQQVIDNGIYQGCDVEYVSSAKNWIDQNLNTMSRQVLGHKGFDKLPDELKARFNNDLN